MSNIVVVDGLRVTACARHENGQRQMTKKVEMESSLLSSLSCPKILLETHVTVTSSKYRLRAIICLVPEEPEQNRMYDLAFTKSTI